MSSRRYRNPVSLGLAALSAGAALSLPAASVVVGVTGVTGATVDRTVAAVSAPVGALAAALGNATNGIGTFH